MSPNPTSNQDLNITDENEQAPQAEATTPAQPTPQERYEQLKSQIESNTVQVTITPSAFKWLQNFIDNKAKVKGVEMAFAMHEVKIEMLNIRAEMEAQKLFSKQELEKQPVNVRISKNTTEFLYRAISNHEGEGFQAAQHIFQSGLPVRAALVEHNENLKEFKELETSLGYKKAEPEPNNEDATANSQAVNS